MPPKGKENSPIGDHKNLFLAIELDLNSRRASTSNCENIEERFLRRILCACDQCSILRDQLKICFAKLKHAIVGCVGSSEDYLTDEELLVKELADECMRVFSTIIQSSCFEQRDYLGRS
jgi:hypothetical protein